MTKSAANAAGILAFGLMAALAPPPATAPEITTFHSFDGGFVERAYFCRPDRYRMVEAAVGQGKAIARGGGYSYAAASFGGGSLVLDMTRLDRVLRIQPEERLVEVEAGMRLEQLLALTAPRGLILPVQPGYPAITVGGCIAANVHGKNPHLEGTFRRSVVDVTLFHPRLGTLRLDRQTESELFEMTCGGYGLTGIILAATLRLEPLPGWTASVERVPIDSLAEGLTRLRELTPQSAFAYTWHDGTPIAGAFGRGFVYVGQLPEGPPPRGGVMPRYRRLTAASRPRLRVPIWGRTTSRLLGAGFLRRLDAYLDVEVQEVLSGPDRLADGMLRVQVVDGRFHLGPAQVNVPGGTLRLSFAYDPSAPEVELAAGAYVERFDYGILARRLQPAEGVRGLFSLNLELAGKAPSLDQIMRHADGKLDFAVWPEEVRGGIFNLWSVNLLLAVLPVIDPGGESHVNCIVGRFDLKDGILSDDKILIDTTRVRVRGAGSANLATEKLAFVFRPRAKGLALFRVQTPLRVTGTLTDYNIGIEGRDLFISTLRMLASPIIVPFERLTLGPLPRDGADVCTDPLRR